MNRFDIYLNGFDRLIHVQQKVKKTVSYFMVVTDIALVSMVVNHVKLICEYYYHNDVVATKTLIAFVLHMIEDLSINMADIQMLQFCCQLYARYKSINVTLKTIMRCVDKVIGVRLKAKLESRRTKNVVFNTHNTRRHELQVSVEDYKFTTVQNEIESELLVHSGVDNLKFFQTIRDLHAAYFYAYQAFGQFHSYYQFQMLLALTGCFMMSLFSSVLITNRHDTNFNGAEWNNVFTTLIRIFVIINIVDIMTSQVYVYNGYLLTIGRIVKRK